LLTKLHAVSLRFRTRPWLAIAGGLWLTCVAAGLATLWAYDNAPGEGATAPTTWPSATTLQRSSDRPTLVVLAHPQCSCTRASLGELAEALARADVKPKTYVLFLKPDGFTEDWLQSDLWRTAASLPDTTVIRDDNGQEALRFGASTSGQTLLYDKSGHLLFAGGITGARAHRGDNEGRRAIVALLNQGSSASPKTNVFGCRLFAPGV
jgi:hypothetical protein